MSDITMRQAVQAAADVEPILQAMFGDGNYRIDPSWIPAETVWSSTAGESKYNMADPDLASQLLEQAGYEATSDERDADVVYFRRPATIAMNGDRADERGTWAGHYTAHGARVDVAGSYTAQWVPIDGRWRLAAELFRAL